MRWRRRRGFKEKMGSQGVRVGEGALEAKKVPPLWSRSAAGLALSPRETAL